MRSGGRRWMAVLGGTQGFALWLLYDRWPEDRVAVALFTALCFFVVAHGLVIHFARTGQHAQRLNALAAVTGAVFAAIALWVAWQLPGPNAGYEGDEDRVFSWCVAAAVALYALGPFVQIYQASGAARFPYPDLYRHSWNNFFVLLFGGLYAGALWVVLALWQELFGLIGIEIFEKVFSNAAFVYPATAAAVGYGLAAGRESEATIATLRGLTQSLFRALLPVVAAVTVGFAASLPFTGLEPLFATRSAAAILIGWLAAFVLLVNAVYLDGAAPPPYGRALRYLVEIGILVLPVLAAIAGWAIHLRVGQYGITPDRVFAGAFTLVLGLYALGYAAAVVSRGAPWLPRIREVNLAMAIVLVCVAFALHTPIADPLAWSARDQLARLRSAAVRAAAVDFGYLRFELGHYGDAVLKELEQNPPADDAELVRSRIAVARAAQNYWTWQNDEVHTRVDVEHSFVRRPEGAPWPPGLRESLVRLMPSNYWLNECGKGDGDGCTVFSADLDRDGRAEEIVVYSHGSWHVQLVALGEREGEWRAVGTLQSPEPCCGGRARDALLEAVDTGRVELVPRAYSDIRIDGVLYRFQLE